MGCTGETPTVVKYSPLRRSRVPSGGPRPSLQVVKEGTPTGEVSPLMPWTLNHDPNKTEK